MFVVVLMVQFLLLLMDLVYAYFVVMKELKVKELGVENIFMKMVHAAVLLILNGIQQFKNVIANQGLLKLMK
jgi:hypothetical protein